MSSLVVGPVFRHSDDHTIADLFALRVADDPGAPALSHDGVTLSYGEADRISGRLARRLLDAGVGHGDLVPLVMPTGLEVPIAMLATMKIGAPFVPMDSCWPEARLHQVLTAIAPKVALCRTGETASVPTDVLTVDLTMGTADPLEGAARPALDDLIYGFYTSGSTGVPKCALNLHRGLRNRFAYMSRRFGAGRADVVLQNSPHVFDSSIWQLLWPLTQGAHVVVPRNTGVVDLLDVLETIHRHRVTMTDFVPTVFNVLVELLRAQPELAAKLTSLRHLLIGGEEMLAEPVQAFRRMLPDVRITNTYGPTEASIGMIFHEVRDEDVERIPIGLPIDNTCAAVLDEEMNPVPAGATGQLYIGGECVGAGYLDDPERTRAAFVANPIPELPTARLYRTGDLADLRDDGLIAFRGRQDDQVKVGGVRVEPGEVESVLRTCPGVSEARIVVYADEAGVNRLAGFVTGRVRLESHHVLDHVRGQLPGSLVPTLVIQLDSMPFNGNGKLDRAELVRRATAYRRRGAEQETDPVARAVRETWLRLVPGDDGPDGDFFANGGDSLTAVRLTLTLNERLGTSLTARDVVAAPTMAALTARITDRPVAYRTADADLRLVMEDSRLPADIRPIGVTAREARRILLTGATGFIGAHLLHDLLSRTGATVYCLVRAADATEAQDRIHDSLVQFHLSVTDMDRVVAVPADLSAPRLGLGAEEYGRLAAEIDTIIHNGARVNLLLDYRHHRAANVAGTVEILRLAALRRHKALHFVSTLSVLDSAAGGSELPPGPKPPAAGGYSLSKWAAERLVDEAARRGLAVAVYRLGEIMPHSVTGVPSPRSLPDMLIRWCLRLGVTFRSPTVMDYTPVDQVAALVTAGVSGRGRGWYHLAQRRRMRFDDLLAGFAGEFGLNPVSYREFWELLRAELTAGPGPHDDLMRLLTTAPAAGPEVTDDELADSLERLLRDGDGDHVVDRSLKLLAAAGVRFPSLDSEALLRYAAHHRRLRRGSRLADAGRPGH
ncbi:peptide synthetase [Acrocarpospora phusangensis]|uniref:Peptide synthetase n=1 Tax=Acrocarpospora phusangensis TaxID=1070424 RepID=A0A919UPE4_9ACTN|nr:non-ribosomal peptide synthetase [Acrocarpospora phusangensis]GIH28759.1 peptide synthetase [Acrocarpospora phusangensis]